MGWRIFKHTDVNAPGITFSARGSLAALLRACLIDGYGATLPVGGWSEPFAETNSIAVFRADAGARQFYQINDRDNDADVARMNAFESMSDVEIGAGQWCANRYFGKHYNDSIYGWVVLANESSVHILFPSRYGWVPHFFGEYDSTWSNNPYNSCVIGHVLATAYLYNVSAWYNSALISPGTTISSASPVATRPVDHHRLPDGTNLGFDIMTIHSSYRIGPSETSTYALDITGDVVARPVFTPLFLGVSASNIATTDPLYRRHILLGVLPQTLGAYHRHFDMSTEALLLYEYTDSDSGKTLLHAPISYSSSLADRTYITYDITGAS